MGSNTKHCTDCGEPKKVTDFHFKNKAKGLRRANCKECQKARANRHYRKNVAYYVAKSAKTKKRMIREGRDLTRRLREVPCADCGDEHPWYVMQFDHVRGTKRSDVSTLVSHACGLATIKAEIAKCEVVCANCHATRTHNRRTAMSSSH